MRYHFGLGVGHLYSRPANNHTHPSSLGEVRASMTGPDDEDNETRQLLERPVEDEAGNVSDGSFGADEGEADENLSEDDDDDDFLAIDEMYA